MNTAIALSLIIITLIGTEIGFMYFMKREFQKTADLAALAGAQQIRSGCTAATTAAQLNANGASSSDTGRNMPVGLTPLGAQGEIQCGYWDQNTSFQTPAATGPANAVRVSFTRNSPTLLSFFVGNRAITVTAVAALSAPLAQFSVGSTLIAVNGDSTLGRLLKGIGLDLSGTSLVGYNGLAQAKITPGGLLAALGIPVAADIGVGELNTLLAGRSVALGDLLNAVVTLAGQNSLLSSNIALLQAIQAKLGLTNLMVQLGSVANGPRGLFAQIISPAGSGSGALNVGVSALDLLYTSIGVATAQHAIDISSLNINLLSLAKVSAQAIVISPPSIGIGGIGATAYNAQVRTYIQVTTAAGPLGSVLEALVKLNLPIVLDAVTGTGTITDMCTPALQSSTGQDRVQFLVKSSILNACVGKVAQADIYSNVNACNTVQSTELINILGLLKANTSINLNNSLAGPDSVLVLAQGETGTSSANNLQLGTLVSTLLTQLTQVLFGPASRPPTGTQPLPTDLDSLTNQLWNNTASICTASTLTCLGQRYNSAINTINQNAGQSGLLTGLLNGVLGLVSGLLNQCTGLFSQGEQGCKNMIRDALADQSNSTGGGVISNAVSFLAGLLQPLLNAIGASVLTPLLQNVLGINLGQVDVNLKSLDCKALPMLVY
ncbi:TadG family pilus assembly protein [Variovorax sp.]|uniref:TadG family pilus assembly protein n=1 Tax=Variovorax sp. TaxID=1871043 RepID=UPI003BAC50B2